MRHVCDHHQHHPTPLTSSPYTIFPNPSLTTPTTIIIILSMFVFLLASSLTIYMCMLYAYGMENKKQTLD
ncbi:hypothetical protein EON63_16740 [archaeon]|nr:MAG: hypothetical protein EON63_16740 [archaeon]